MDIFAIVVHADSENLIQPICLRPITVTAFDPNEEIRQELSTAVESSNWDEILSFQRESEGLLNATLQFDEKNCMIKVITGIRRSGKTPRIAAEVTVCFLARKLENIKSNKNFRNGKII